MSAERKPLISPVCNVPAPIIQVMPRGRARIDPTARQGLMTWVFAIRTRYDRMARQTLRGLKDELRESRKKQIEYARRMVELCDTLTDSLFTTLPLSTLEECAAYLAGQTDRVPTVE